MEIPEALARESENSVKNGSRNLELIPRSDGDAHRRSFSSGLFFGKARPCRRNYPRDLARTELLRWASQLHKPSAGAIQNEKALETALRKVHPVFSSCDFQILLKEAPTPIFERQSFSCLLPNQSALIPLESYENVWGFLRIVGVCETSRALLDEAAIELSFWTLFISQHLDERFEKERLKKALRGLSKSTGAAVHEVRNPLTSVKLQVYLLKKAFLSQGANGFELDYSLNLLDDLDAEILRIGFHLEDLALVSQINAGQFVLRKKRGDLAQIARDTVAKFDRIFSMRGVHCTLTGGDHPIMGLWDGVRFEQVLSNLLSNAWKYGRGRPIQVRIETEIDGGAQAIHPFCKIRVRDQGCGILNSEKERIFEGFFRTEDALGEKGSGLGLFVTKSLVSAMGGKIHVESEWGSGSEFVVWLPILTDGFSDPR